MDIDFIKWMVEYADGFKMEPFKNTWELSYHECYGSEYNDTSIYSLYPFLLQRAIEGINNNGNHWIIEQRECGSYILGHEEIDTSGDSYDISKEKALAYIYNQEKL